MECYQINPQVGQYSHKQQHTEKGMSRHTSCHIYRGGRLINYMAGYSYDNYRQSPRPDNVQKLIQTYFIYSNGLIHYCIVEQFFLDSGLESSNVMKSRLFPFFHSFERVKIPNAMLCSGVQVEHKLPISNYPIHAQRQL